MQPDSSAPEPVGRELEWGRQWMQRSDSSFQGCGISRQRYEADNAVFCWDVERISAPERAKTCQTGSCFAYTSQVLGMA